MPVSQPRPTTDPNAVADIVVIGGGIFGICIAWDAVLRGLRVVLIERGDFAEATSANCFKIVHGGLRYLQHADLARVRESAHELATLLRIAPHLVEPLPIVVPTYGHGRQGKELLRAALWVYGLVTFDRNRRLRDPHRRIAHGRVLSREECLARFPGIKSTGLTGAVVFHDGQVYNPARLALAYLKAAVEAGAVALNYTEAIGFLKTGDGVAGVAVRDTLTGARFEIRARVTINAGGPWAERLLQAGLGLRITPRLSFSRDAFFVVKRRVAGQYALALPARTRDPDAVLSRGARHLFIVPWRQYTLVGVWHRVYTGDPDAVAVTETEVQDFLREINEAYPRLSLTPHDVAMVHGGLVLFGENMTGATDLSYGHRSRIVDHAREHGTQGLVTVVGVRYTTSRAVATRAVDVAFQKLGRPTPRSSTATTPIAGGQIVGQFEDYLRNAIARRPPMLTAETVRSLVHQHGSHYEAVLAYLDEDPTLAETLGSSAVIKAEVIHAVRREFARTLGDVVFRRTNLGTGGCPGAPILHDCAELMAPELGWDESRIEKEIGDVHAAYGRVAGWREAEKTGAPA
jgi:glycerol-3-phosphate dehydrogenase